MKKLKLLIAAMAAALATSCTGGTAPAYAHDVQAAPLAFASCAPLTPYGTPFDTKQGTTKICRHAYVLEHDNKAKIPVWVAYTLTPEHTDGCIPRSNAFAADASLPVGSRSEKSDYAASGYDIGHIANDADMSWSDITEHESFLLTNMAPQLPGLNRGIWKVLESNTRAWAYNRKHTLLIYAGPIYDVNKDKTIGANKVVVADSFYKIVVDTQTKETMAFVFPHHSATNSDLTPFLTSVANIEKLTGVKFAVPTDKNAVSKLWPEDLSPVAKEKKLLCKSSD